MVAQFSVSVLSPEVLVEDVGDDCLVYVPGTESVVTLSGDTANALRQIQSGLAVDPTSPSVSELIRLGIVQASSPMSRRNVIRAGLIGAGAGVAALSLPSVAAASSDSAGGSTSSDTSTSGGDDTSGDTAVLLLIGNVWNGSGHDLSQFKLGLQGLNADFSQPATVTLSDGTTTIPMTKDTHTTGGVTIDVFWSGFLTPVIPGALWYSLTHTIAFTAVGGGSETATFTAPAPPSPPS